MRILITLIFSFAGFLGMAQAAPAKDDDQYDRIKDSLTRAGHADQLIPYFLNELKKHPNDEIVNRTLGFLYIEANNPDLGEKYYREAIRINPNCARCYMHIGRVYVLRKDSAKAMEMFDKAVAMDPNDGDHYSIRSDLKGLQHDYVGALLDVNKAIKTRPGFAGYYLQRGLLNLVNGYYDAAIADCSKAIDLDTTNYNSWLHRGKAYYQKKMYTEAAADISKAIETKGSPSFLYSNRADVYKEMGMHKESIADYTKALELSPNDCYSFYYRAENKLNIEDVEGACDDLNKGYAILKKTDPQNSLKESFEFYLANRCDSTRPGYYYQSAMGLNVLMQYEKSIDVCSRGIKKFPDHSLTLFTRGTAYMGISEPEPAFSDFSRAFANKENLLKELKMLNHDKTEAELNEIYINFLVMIYQGMAQSALSLGKTDEALVYINKAIDISPVKNGYGFSLLYMSRGLIHFTSRKYLQAKNDFDTCIFYDPKSAIAYEQRASAELVIANSIKMVANPKSTQPNGKPSKVNWDFPLDMKIKKDEPGTRQALKDLDKAIELEPLLETAYFLRGVIYRSTGEADHCKDLLKAQELNYYVEPILLKDCKK